MNYRRFMHEINPNSLLADDFGFRQETAPQDKEIITRLVNYYQFIRNEHKAIGGIWNEISKFHGALDSCLMTGNIGRLSDIFATLGNTPFITGFEEGPGYWNVSGSNHDDMLTLHSVNFIDKLLSLGNALGVIPVQCPEQGMWGYPVQYDLIDTQDLYRKVMDAVGFDAAPPNVCGGIFGFKVGDRVISERNLQGLYTALRVKGFQRDIDLGCLQKRKRHVAEIGGGMGSVSYYLFKMGISVPGATYLFDLPIVSVIQAYFLMKTLGKENVWLYGETRPPKIPKVRILPYWKFQDGAVGLTPLFDVVINQDSMPEFDKEVALDYLKTIPKVGRNFLSINQEAQAGNWTNDGKRQLIVHELVKEANVGLKRINVGLKRISRNPCWMRSGYVEEIYTNE